MVLRDLMMCLIILRWGDLEPRIIIVLMGGLSGVYYLSILKLRIECLRKHC